MALALFKCPALFLYMIRAYLLPIFLARRWCRSRDPPLRADS
ncbi:MAG: hypothetical protein R2862_12605 [Thermoanaerobaculia bacterium]